MIRLLSRFILSASPLVVPLSQQANSEPIPLVKGVNNASLLNSKEINKALSELGSTIYVVREPARERLKLHMQALIKAGYINRLEIFIERLKETESNTPHPEVRERIRSLFNSSDLLDAFSQVPENSQRIYIKLLANTGIISRDIVSTDLKVRKRFLQNENIHPAILTFLSRDQDENIRKEVAGNQHTLFSDLAKLAADQSKDVRSVVARNPNTLPIDLAKLATDQTKDVRSIVARNPNLHPSILSRLVGDQEATVRASVAMNQNTLSVDLARLTNDQDEIVRFWVAGNRNTLPVDLSKLSKDQNSDVRYAVVGNLNSTTDTLKILVTDQDKSVADFAQRTLALRSNEN